jgi:acetyl esterase/lipase
MPLAFTPELETALAPIVAMRQNMQRPALHDSKGRRALVGASIGALISALPEANVTWEHHKIPTKDGFEMPAIQFTPKNYTGGRALCWIHGGGMIIGELDIWAKAIALQAEAINTLVVAMDYRVAPENPHPAPVEDCYAALQWMNKNATKLNIDPARIGVWGESAGGGLAAGVALMARDRNLSPPLAKQILIYPMLDDRTLVPNEEIAPFAFWSYDDNITGWTALLGDKAGKDGVSPYAAPARAESLKGLPPTYIDVGELDIFRDEDIEYAARLAKENISVELHVYPGAPHAFEAFGAGTKVAETALELRRAAARMI